MGSYNYFVSGFVKEVWAKIFSNICLLVGGGGISQFQKLSETAHYNCMAGFGVACLPIGAMVYCRVVTEKKDSVTITGEKVYWGLPSKQEVSYNIDFSCPDTSETNVTRPEKKIKEVPSSTPTEIELQDFFRKLSLSKSKPAILSLVSPYNMQYKPVHPRNLTSDFERIVWTWVHIVELKETSCKIERVDIYRPCGPTSDCCICYS